MKRRIGVLLALTVAAAAHAASAAEDAWLREGAAAPDGRIEILAAAGEIEVVAWDRSAYRVEAGAADGVQRVDVTDAQGVLTVRVVEKAGFTGRGGARLQVSIPAASRLDVVTSSARVTVRAFTGAVNVRSASGAIVLDAPRGPAELRSISGLVRVQGAGISTTLHAESLSGRVEIRDVAGSVEASSIAGAIDIAMSMADHLRAHGHAGRVQVDARLSAQAEVDLQSFGGAVQARLLADGGYRYDTAGSGGALRTCFGAIDRSGSVGEGLARVRLRSFGGAISLCNT